MTPTRRGRSAHSLRTVWPAIVLLLVIVATVEFVVAAGIVNAFILPRPSDVVTSLVSLFARGLIWEHIGATAYETIVGFVIGSGIAFLLAVLASMSGLLRRAVSPYVIALQVTPLVAVAPLIIAWLGFGYASKIAIAALICFFPVFVNTASGMLSTDRTEEELFRSLRASPIRTLTRLRLRRALPTIFAGLKTAMTLALIGAVVGEFVSAERGLGLLVTRYSYQLAVASAFAVVIVLTVLGLLLYGAMVLAERWIVFWRSDTRLATRESRALARHSGRASGPSSPVPVPRTSHT